ncbi:uncharacterized protein LOC115034135 [Acyrthosiphon pisum]|uniref:Uncharacterized protein n=1 Tax=Acyrthosiphon pisum TaxID=7029 RepID=A0A8R2NQT5_ACYPI|nr:uncharacterized protein LOC115034135 [Acyrthosiphon pisum]
MWRQMAWNACMVLVFDGLVVPQRAIPKTFNLIYPFIDQLDILHQQNNLDPLKILDQQNLQNRQNLLKQLITLNQQYIQNDHLILTNLLNDYVRLTVFKNNFSKYTYLVINSVIF